jgi:putative peptidoglycan lipid II flippase
MTVGSVAVFQFAYNLQSFPLAVIGASYSIAAFPMLADLHAQKRFEEFRFHIMTALRHIIFWSVPIIGLIVVLRAQFVRVVLGSGAFDWSDTRLTAAVLALLVLSLFAQAINLLVVRAFYAGGYTRLPFFVTLGGALFAVTFTYVLYVFYQSTPAFAATMQSLMRVSTVTGSEVMMIGLGYSIATIIQTTVLLVLAARTFSLRLSPFLGYFGRSIFAACVGASSAYLTLNFVVEGVRAETFVGIFIQGFLAGVLGLLGVGLGYYALKSPELTEVYRAFHARIFKTDVIAPQEDIL